MTLDELNQINVSDPEAVKALQTFLRSRGYYSGKVDGKWQDKTIEGVKTLRGDLQQQASTQRDTAVAGAETEKAKNSPLRIAQEAGPYAGGTAAGVATGYGLSRMNKASDVDISTGVSNALADKKTSPIIAERVMDQRMNARRWRAAGQSLFPAIGFGGAELTRRYIKPNMEESTRPYVDMAANAEQGFGAGTALMVAKNAVSDVFGKNPVPLDQEAALRTRAAEARGDPYTISDKAKTATTATPALDPTRMAELRGKRAADLRTEAKAAGLHVSGTKEDLVRRIAEAPATAAKPAGRLPRGKGGVLFPLMAGAVAYDAETSDAEAAGIDPVNAKRRSVLAGATAAGATAAVPYATSKLPEAMGTAARATGPGLVPSTVDAMTDYSPEDLAQGRNTLARYLPSAMRGGAVEDAYQMAQVPERSPARTQLLASANPGAARQDDFDTHLQAFLDAIEEHNSGFGGGGDQGYGP